MRLREKSLALLVQVTDRSVLSWQVLGMTVAASVLIHLFTSSDLGFSNVVIRSFFAAISVLPMYALVWLAFRIPIKSKLVRALVVYACYIAGGALRGAMLATFLDLAGIVPNDGISYRVMASAFSMSNTIAILTYFWSSLNRFLDSIREQSREHGEIRQSLELLAKESKKQASEQSRAITEEILSTLSALKVRSNEDQVREITSLIDDRVRPLSKALLENSAVWQPSTDRSQRTTLTEVLSNLNFGKHIPPSLLTIVLALAPFPIISPIFGLDRALVVSLLTFSIMFPLAFIFRRFLAGPISGLNVWIQVPVITAAYLLIGAVGSLGTVIGLSGTPQATALVIPGIFAAVFFAWILNIGLASLGALSDLQQSLESLGRTLRWATSRANLVSLNNRRVLARFLHGPVQASLHALIFRLREQNQEQPTDLIFDELRERLAQAQETTLTLAELRNQLRDFESVWDGIAKVDIHLAEQAETMLGSDPQLSSHLLELAGQLISTAVRKRNASKVEIEISATEFGQLELAITADGDQAIESSGSEQIDLLSACAIEIGGRIKAGVEQRYLVLPSAQAL